MHPAVAMMAAALIAAPDAKPGKTSAPPPDPNQVICRREPAYGSRIQADRVCRTRADWDEQTRQVERQIRSYSADQDVNARARDRGGMTFGGS